MLGRLQVTILAASISASCAPDTRNSAAGVTGSGSANSQAIPSYKMSIDEFDAAVVDSAPFIALRHFLPADYHKIASDITSTLHSDMADVDLKRQVQMALSQLRRANAEAAARATDKLRSQYLDVRQAALESIRAVGGDEACASYARTGSASQGPAELIKKFDDEIASLQMQLIAEGRTSATPAPIPELEDQYLLTDSMIENGLSADQVERYNAGDQSPSELCSYLIESLRAARDLEGEPGKRIRAEFIRFSFANS